MTYCLGWTSKTAAFLIADSAITYSEELTENIYRNDKTTFGELQGSVIDGKKYVYENAFKLYSSNKVAFTFAGDIRIGEEIIDLIKEHLESGRSITQAIEYSIANYPSFDSYEVVQILIACYEDKPKIYVIDNEKPPYIKVTDKFISFGTASEDLRSYTLSFYNSFNESRENERANSLADEMMLLRMIALLQSYGTHNYTINNGIGGAYSGLYVTKNGIHWQPDIYYMIHGENPAFDKDGFVSVYVRSKYKFVITERVNCAFSNGIERQRAETEIEDVFKGVVDLFDKGVFKYVVFINSNRHAATIIHMNCKLEHAYLYIDVQPNKKGTIGFLLQDPLHDLINDNFDPIDTPKYAVIRYIPYIPLEDKILETIKRSLVETRITKTHYFDSTIYKGIIYENGNLKEWFYVNYDAIFAFLKDYSKEQIIHIVDCSSDMLALEYKNGVIVFPNIDIEAMNDIFSKIAKNSSKKKVFLFDVLTNDEENQSTIQYTIKILEYNWEEAKKLAELEAKAEFGECYMLTPIGIQYYHPAYS